MSRILIVDDNEQEVRRPLARQLGRIYGADQILDAENGQQALDMVEREHPDLILLDVMMPGMDGYEVCRRLKGNPRTADIPVIFLTGRMLIEDETKGFDAGAVDYITKPISLPVVLARVNTHLKLRHTLETLKGTLETLKKQNITIQEQYLELEKAARFQEDVQQIMQQDLKTPLNEIISATNTIFVQRRPEVNEEYHFYKLLHAANQLLTMINVSIEIYKIEHGDYLLVPQPFDLYAVVREVVQFEEKRQGIKGVTMHIFLHDRIPLPSEAFMVFGEELLCYSLTTNLIQHAMESSRHGDAIQIDLGGRDPSIMKIGYSDKVPVERRDSFFQKYIMDGIHKRFGPYAAKKLVEIQNGTITVETNGQHGVTVIVGLPSGWVGG